MDLKNKFIVIMEGKVGNSFGCLFYAHKIAKESVPELKQLFKEHLFLNAFL